MSEPQYIRQTAEIDLASDEAGKNAQAWWSKTVTQGMQEACTHFRFSWDAEHNLLLTEGWSRRPHDEGIPRFQLIAGAA